MYNLGRLLALLPKLQTLLCHHARTIRHIVVISKYPHEYKIYLH